MFEPDNLMLTKNSGLITIKKKLNNLTVNLNKSNLKTSEHPVLFLKVKF